MATKKQTNKNKAIELSDREAPTNRNMSIESVVGSVMAEAQLRVLTSKTPEHAIKTRPGGRGKLLKYVPHGYVTDMLNKAFGFDWDYKLLPYFDGGSIYHLERDVEVGINPKTKKPILVNYISIYGELTVRIHNPQKLSEIVATVTKPGPGSAVWYPENEWGDALKAAKSDGLKVAAHELGIALDLYWDDEAEFNQYEKEQEDKRKREEAEIINAIVIPEGYPHNAIQMLSKAKTELHLELPDIESILGKKFAEIQAEYKIEYWDKLKENKKKDS